MDHACRCPIPEVRHASSKSSQTPPARDVLAMMLIPIRCDVVDRRHPMTTMTMNVSLTRASHRGRRLNPRTSAEYRCWALPVCVEPGDHDFSVASINMRALITPVLVVVWLLVVISFWTGATHRWLLGRGLMRQVAIVIQAVVLSLSFA